MCVLASQPLRQSSYHACMVARISLGYWPSALVPTPFDDDGGGCFDCKSDWALAPTQLRSNESANTLGNVRMDTTCSILDRSGKHAPQPRRHQLGQIPIVAGCFA